MSYIKILLVIHSRVNLVTFFGDNGTLEKPPALDLSRLFNMGYAKVHRNSSNLNPHHLIFGMRNTVLGFSQKDSKEFRERNLGVFMGAM